LHCFKDDGSENWNFTIPNGYPLAMYLSNDTLFIATTEKELIALNLKNRTIKWTKELAGFGYDSITINNNVLYVQAKNLYAINSIDGKILWQINSKSEEGFCRGAPVVSNGIIYATEQNGRLISGNLNDGAILKEFYFGEIIRCAIILENNVICLATIKKKVYAIDTTLFK
jgi:outer membrane protein assembly factor BamB